MMKFSKYVCIAAMLFVFAGMARAQIPTTDIAHIATSVANQLETLAQWNTQYQQMKTTIEQYKKQYDAITGPRGMAALLNSPLVNSALPPNWQSVLASVKKSAYYLTERRKYPTLTNAPKANAMFDLIASQNATMSTFYDQANARIEQIKSLMVEIDSAGDPAAKMDLTNRLVSEQGQVQAHQNLIGILQAKQKQDLEVASQEAVKEISCKEFKRTSC
jgi:type IV secretion system protein VirB5